MNISSLRDRAKQADSEDDEPQLKRGEWMSDDLASACPMCSRQFNMITRKHHCRSCGKIFCNKCSRKRFSLPDVDPKTPQRVCEPCFDTLCKIVSK